MYPFSTISIKIIRKKRERTMNKTPAEFSIKVFKDLKNPHRYLRKNLKTQQINFSSLVDLWVNEDNEEKLIDFIKNFHQYLKYNSWVKISEYVSSLEFIDLFSNKINWNVIRGRVLENKLEINIDWLIHNLYKLDSVRNEPFLSVYKVNLTQLRKLIKVLDYTNLTIVSRYQQLSEALLRNHPELDLIGVIKNDSVESIPVEYISDKLNPLKKLLINWKGMTLGEFKRLSLVLGSDKDLFTVVNRNNKNSSELKEFLRTTTLTELNEIGIPSNFFTDGL